MHVTDGNVRRPASPKERAFVERTEARLKRAFLRAGRARYLRGTPSLQERLLRIAVHASRLGWIYYSGFERSGPLPNGTCIEVPFKIE